MTHHKGYNADAILANTDLGYILNADTPIGHIIAGRHRRTDSGFAGRCAAAPPCPKNRGRHAPTMSDTPDLQITADALASSAPRIIRLASRLDQLPISPHRVGLVIRRTHNRNARQASSNHTKLDLITGRIAETLINTQIVTAARHARWATQRLRHGYDDRDIWDLGARLAHHTANLLDRLADTAWGWPGEHNGYPDETDWQEALTSNARKLRAWSEHGNLFDGPDSLEDRLERRPQEQRDAQDAFRWVADNLPNLWD